MSQQNLKNHHHLFKNKNNYKNWIIDKEWYFKMHLKFYQVMITIKQNKYVQVEQKL